MKLEPYPEYKDSGVEWLGDVPAHWEAWKISHAFGAIGSGTTPPSGEEKWYIGTTPWINTGELRENTIFQTEKFVSDEALISFSALQMHPAGSLAIAMYGATIGRLGIFGIPATVNQACCVISRPKYLDTIFVFYWFLGFKNILVDLYAVGGGQPNINQAIIAGFRVPAPCMEEQKKIANFLDRETAKIDALISEQQDLIALLREKRQAVISRAVTRGLKPNVPMKDSGVEWLGEIPVHWKVHELRRVIKEGTSITYGIVQAGPEVVGGIQYIRTSDMSGNELPIDGYPRTSLEIDAAYSRSKVEAGDIVVAIRATVGKPLIVPKELEGANLTQGTAKISPGPIVINQFLKNSLNGTGSQQRFEALAKGATFKEITLDMLRRFKIPLPPLIEQSEILQFLNKEIGDIDRVIAEADSTISLLQERRTALISAVVTGKVDVREVACV